MPTPAALSTKNLSTQRRPSRRHWRSTRKSPWAWSTGETTASIRASRSVASTPATPRGKKKVGSAHFFRSLAHPPPPQQGECGKRLCPPQFLRQLLDAYPGFSLRDPPVGAVPARPGFDQSLFDEGAPHPHPHRQAHH